MGAGSKTGVADTATARDRCLSGIEGLDDILHGGIPKGNLVLIAGSVGTGKTTLCLEFLVRGAERGRALALHLGHRGLGRASSRTSPPSTSSARTSSRTGPSCSSTFRSSTSDSASTTRSSPGEEIDILTRSILDLVSELNVKRVVHRLADLGHLPDRAGRTSSRLHPEPRPGVEPPRVHHPRRLRGRRRRAGGSPLHGVEEALVDGVIVLGNATRQGDILRVLQVVKMRGTSHSRAQYVLELSPIGLLMAPHLKGNRLEGA